VSEIAGTVYHSGTKASAWMPGMDSAMTGMLDAFRTSQKLNIEAGVELSSS
jgi:hypothetical protein